MNIAKTLFESINFGHIMAVRLQIYANCIFLIKASISSICKCIECMYFDKNHKYIAIWIRLWFVMFEIIKCLSIIKYEYE